MTTTQTTATNAPAWAMPGMTVALRNGYSSDSYTLRKVARHTKTRIILEPAGTFGSEVSFTKSGRRDDWLEYGASKYYESSIHDPAGKLIQSIDKTRSFQKARNEVQKAAQEFANKSRRWTTVKDAEELQEALGRFITTMTALGEE